MSRVEFTARHRPMAACRRIRLAERHVPARLPAVELVPFYGLRPGIQARRQGAKAPRRQGGSAAGRQGGASPEGRFSGEVRDLRPRRFVEPGHSANDRNPLESPSSPLTCYFVPAIRSDGQPAWPVENIHEPLSASVSSRGGSAWDCSRPGTTGQYVSVAFVSRISDCCTATLDFYHASEYVALASTALYPGERQLEEKQQWLEDQCHRLKHTIGSGVTEAGCKVIIKQRLCQAGMRWKEKGCASVLRLRALNRTEGRWEQFWHWARFRG